jgi:hypothetical protein
MLFGLSGTLTASLQLSGAGQRGLSNPVLSPTIYPRTFCLSNLRKEREGWGGYRGKKQMFLPATAAWATRSFVFGGKRPDFLSINSIDLKVRVSERVSR